MDEDTELHAPKVTQLHIFPLRPHTILTLGPLLRPRMVEK